MTIKIAINGYGRIGRNILRALYEEGRRDEIQIVAVNSLCDGDHRAYLTKRDTVHGVFPYQVDLRGEDLVIAGDVIKTYREKDPAQIPWKNEDVDVVLECSGLFRERELAEKHITSGAKKVIISAPGKNVDATIVYGVNHDVLKSEHTIISNASCTTNCLAPIAKVLNDHVGIESGLMTTVHSYTNDQKLTDVYHKDFRRARSATMSMIPTKTGAAVAVGEVLPELAGKLDGFAVRVPIINVSMLDLTFQASRKTTVDEINDLMKKASEGAFKHIIAYNDELLVSVDFNHNKASSIFDSTLTKVIDNTVKVIAWYDNEWGFSNRMLDAAVALMQAK